MAQSYVHPLDDQGRCILGAHTSSAGGILNAVKEGKIIDATGVQFTTGIKSQWRPKPYVHNGEQLFRNLVKETGILINTVHANYLINLGSNKPEVLEKSRTAFKDDVRRCHALGIHFMVFHPGSATGAPVDECLDRIVESLIDMKELIESGSTQILLENTAGQGTCIGKTFEQLKHLIDRIEPHFPIFVCLDTCHLFAAGYDIRTRETFDQTFKEFDRIVGLKYLRVLHVNDSLGYFGSRIDRHANLGEGYLGWETFQILMTDPRTALVPKYIETSGALEVLGNDIKVLRAMALGAECPKNKPSEKMRVEGKVKVRVKAKKEIGEENGGTVKTVKVKKTTVKVTKAKVKEEIDVQEDREGKPEEASGVKKEPKKASGTKKEPKKAKVKAETDLSLESQRKSKIETEEAAQEDGSKVKVKVTNKTSKMKSEFDGNHGRQKRTVTGRSVSIDVEKGTGKKKKVNAEI